MFVPTDSYAAPLMPVGRGDFNARHSYINPSVDVADPLGPRTGVVNNDTIARPGGPVGTGTEKQEMSHSAPGTYEPREKNLGTVDYGFNPVTGPSTQVARPVAQSNFELGSPRWTGKVAPRIYRYTREFAQQYNVFGNGSHMSMAGYRPMPHVKARTMNRNRIVPRNVPQPLDDQVTDTSNRSQYGTVFASSYSWK